MAHNNKKNPHHSSQTSFRQ